MNDFLSYKFRASSLPALMSSSRSKTDLLSETAKELIRKCYIKKVYDRDDFIQTPAMTKGIQVESDVLDLISTVTGQTYFKNKTKYENEFICGTPDVSSLPDCVPDIKSSWTIWTFATVEEEKAKKDYFWQLAGYAWMLGKMKGELYYGLVNTPEDLIVKELYKAEANEQREKLIRKNHIYDDIEPSKRLKHYVFDFTEQDFKAIEERVKLARQYLSTLEL